MGWMVPLLLGGGLPAVLWGVTAIFQKQSAASATGPAFFLITFGAMSVLLACVWRPAPWTGPGIAYALAAGACFAAATALINFTLYAYGTPVSKLAPIWSCNVLITLAIGVIVLREGADINLTKLILGTLFIVAGATLVSTA